MLPPQATDLLALGLAEVSPALSFGLDLNAQGEVVAFYDNQPGDGRVFVAFWDNFGLSGVDNVTVIVACRRSNS